MYSCVPAAARNTFVIAAITISSAAHLAAQAASTGGTPPPNPSRFDLYGGYGYIHPVDSDINHNQYQPINPGAVASITNSISSTKKGIDPTHIELRTGDSAGRSVDNILVPAGAIFNSGSTTTFESTSVKRSGQPYGKPGAPKTTKKIRTKAN